jgi:TorA maturation chaperone TorD
MLKDEEKAQLCRVLAWLLSPPDQELVDALASGQIYEILSSHLSGGNGDLHLESLKGEMNRNTTHGELSELFHRSFDNPTSEKILLIESAYKPWTLDPECPLPMAGKRGLVLGDSALHMLNLYRHIGFTVPREFAGWPDHLALELDFLAFLYERYSENEVHQFIIDHLDWIPNLLQRADQCNLPPLYHATLRTVDYFVRQELMVLSQKRGDSRKKEGEPEGEKS